MVTIPYPFGLKRRIADTSGFFDRLGMVQRHDLVNDVDGHWQFTVELMRRWVMQRPEMSQNKRHEEHAL